MCSRTFGRADTTPSADSAALTDRDTLDLVMRRAAAEAVSLVGLGENRQPGKLRPAGWRPDYPLEEQVRAALIAGLTDHGVDACRMSCEVRLSPGDWQPVPNGLDLVLRDVGGSLAAACEFKVGAVDQTLWDLFKLTATDDRLLTGRYMAVVGPRIPSWSGLACGELFPDEFEDTKEPESFALFASYPDAWRALLKGNERARLLSAPESVSVRLIARERLTHWDAFELRIVRVEPGTGGTIHFDRDSRWPLGLEHLAGGGKSHPSPRPRQLRADPSGASPPAPLVDCAGYDVPAKFKSRDHADAWLRANVSAMAPDVYAAFENELRRRGWTTQELAERVRPLRSATPNNAVMRRDREAR